MTDKADIFLEIVGEIDRQVDKWGVQNHLPIEWCAILGEEVGEVNREALEYHFKPSFDKKIENTRIISLQNYRKELIQVAAVCVSMIQSLERNELK